MNPTPGAAGADRLLLERILESVPMALLAADESGRAVRINVNAEMLFGVRRIDALDEPLGEALPAPASTALAELFDAVRADGRVHDREIELVIRGARLPLGVTASPLALAGSSLSNGVVFICRDLRLTRELQKLRELDTMKTEFVQTVTHELKTPLTAILGGLEMLREDGRGFSRSQRDLLALVNEGATRLQQLVFDILSVERLQRASAALIPQPVDLLRAAEDLRRRLPPESRERVKIVCRTPPPPAAADPERIQEVLENLVSNALKYSPEDRPVDLSLRAARSKILVEVRDRGIGIRAEDRKHLFEKFFRSEEARKLGREGTGLGLTITREIVRLHGGRISFRSRRGTGTTFTVELPVWKGDSHAR